MGLTAKEPKPHRKSAVLGVAVLACLVAVVFFRVSNFEFVDLDTPTQVTKNPHICGLTRENVKHIFSSWCVTSYYPVRTLTYAIDYQIWGLNPRGFKLTNVLIHLANVLLVFWLILRFRGRFPKSSNPSQAWWDVAIAAFSAGIFAIHPVVVEPVAWVPGREELLMTLGALGCIHFHVSARRVSSDGGGTWKVLTLHALATFCCALACLSNAIGAVIPMLIVAWDLLTLEGPKFRRIICGTGLLWLIAAMTIVLKKVGSSVDPFVPEVGALSARRLLIVIDVYWLNLKTLVWPTRLTVDYPRAMPVTIADVGVISGLIVACLTCVMLWKYRRQKVFIFGVAWYALALAPTSQIIPHHLDRADRFLYLPLVGVTIAVAIGLYSLEKRRAMVLAATLGIAGLLTLGTLSARHMRTWRNSLAMWQNCVEIDPYNSLTNRALADHLSDEGRFDRAIPFYRRALALEPDGPDILNNYALRLAVCDNRELRDYELAIRLARKACGLRQWSEPYRHVLALAYMNGATALKQDGRYRRAIEYYQQAVDADPDYEVPLFNLALLLAGCPDESFRDPDRAIQLAERARDILDAPDPLQLGIIAEVYANVGKFDEAIRTVQQAIELAETQRDGAMAEELRRKLTRYRNRTTPDSA